MLNILYAILIAGVALPQRMQQNNAAVKVTGNHAHKLPFFNTIILHSTCLFHDTPILSEYAIILGSAKELMVMMDTYKGEKLLISMSARIHPADKNIPDCKCILALSDRHLFVKIRKHF